MKIPPKATVQKMTVSASSPTTVDPSSRVHRERSAADVLAELAQAETLLKRF